MKVAISGSFNTDDTGPSRVSEGLAHGLAENGVDVVLVSHGDRKTHQHPQVVVENVGRTPDGIGQFLKINKRVRSHFRRGEYDICHPLEEYIFPSDIRTVQWTLDEYERLKLCPKEFRGWKHFTGEILFNLGGRCGASRSKEVVASSPVTSEQMEGYWRFSPDRTIPLGIESEYLSPPCQNPGTRVSMIGRITKKKGQMRVLQYLDRDAEYEVSILGGISDSEYYDRFGHWKENCRGFVPREELLDHYQQTDIVVVPSYHENFSMVALEAIATGNVVVITKECGFASFRWATPENGIYVASDGEQCAQIVKRLSSTDIFEQKEGAYELAKDMTWEKIAEQYIDVYRSL